VSSLQPGGKYRRGRLANHPGLDGTLQSVWPNGLRDRKAPGKTRYLTDAQREAVEACQQPYMDSVAR